MKKNLIYDLIRNSNFEDINYKINQDSLALKFGYTFEDLREYLMLKDEDEFINNAIRDLLT